MKFAPFIFVILGYFTLIASTKGCGDLRAYTADIPAPSITASKAAARVRDGSAVLVDVREDREVRDGMAEPARWMPLSRMNDGDPIWDDFLNGLPKDKLVISYCASGKRAAKAARKMEARGYSVANMGGYSDWTGAGLPTKKPKFPPPPTK